MTEIYEEIYPETIYVVKDIEPGGTVRISSTGGDIYTALTIYNLLKEKAVTVEIVGIAASAASIIAAAGKTIRMASNGLMMLHNPSVGLFGFFNKADLERSIAALTASTSSVIRCYSTRLKPEAVSELLDRETWLSAQEAKAYGLVDEITEPVLDVTGMMNGGVKKTGAEYLSKVRKDVRNEETERIRELQSLMGTNSNVNALLGTAIAQGHTAAEIKPYLDALNLPQKNEATAQLEAMIRGNMTSGAQNVTGGETPDAKALFRQKVIDYANGVA